MQETQETQVRSLARGRCPGGGNGNPLQYFCLENPTDRGVWWATVNGVAKESDTTLQLRTHTSCRGPSRGPDLFTCWTHLPGGSAGLCWLPHHSEWIIMHRVIQTTNSSLSLTSKSDESPSPLGAISSPPLQSTHSFHHHSKLSENKGPVSVGPGGIPSTQAGDEHEAGASWLLSKHSSVTCF